MGNSTKRQWYSAYKIGESEPDLLINTTSESLIYRRLRIPKGMYKIISTKSWVLVKVMSGIPCFFPAPLLDAPTCWRMSCDGRIVSVVIL